MGELEFNNCVVEVTQKRLFADSDGLIGTDIFADFLIHLNYPGRLLKLALLPHRNAPAVPTEIGDRYHFDRFDQGVPHETANLHPIRVLSGKLFLPTVVDEKFRSHFIIDSGAAESIISTELGEQATHLARSGDTVAGVSGRVRDVYRARAVTLQFASFRQQNQGMLSLELKNLSKVIGSEVGGLIGHPTLRHFTLIINYRDGVVGFVHH
ncbi:MAG: aspartyl protease family protein [Acidobacteriota bacterium]